MFLGVGCLALDSLIDVWHGRHHHTGRNYHAARGWLEHAGQAAPRRDGETLITLIGNSQGFASAVPDSVGYAARLTERLTSSVGPTRVLNWCIEGGRGPEFVILGATSARVEPDIVLLVTAPSNFRTFGDARTQTGSPVTGWASDTKRLLGLEETRERLPRAFIEAHITRSDRMDIAVGNRFRPWRYRYVPVGRLTAVPVLQPLLLGFAPPTHPGRLEHPALDQELVHQYLAATRDVGQRNLFVIMPLRSHRREQAAEAIRELRRTVENAGREFLDLSATVPDTLFLDGTHFNEEGHAFMARTLAGLLSP